MTSEITDMENILKSFLRFAWNEQYCPVCGAPWSTKKGKCKNKKCAIDPEEARERWVETRWPILIELAKLIYLKKMKLKKAKKKLKLGKSKIPKKELKILAAILANVQLIDVDWKSIVPLKKLVRSGLFITLTILFWLFLYGITALSLVNIAISLSVGILIPLFVGLGLRAKVNRSVKKAKAREEEIDLKEAEKKEISEQKEEEMENKY